MDPLPYTTWGAWIYNTLVAGAEEVVEMMIEGRGGISGGLIWRDIVEHYEKPPKVVWSWLQQHNKGTCPTALLNCLIDPVLRFQRTQFVPEFSRFLYDHYKIILKFPELNVTETFLTHISTIPENSAEVSITPKNNF